MAVFVLIFFLINNCLPSLLGSENSNNGILEIKSSAISPDQNVVFYKVDDTLNLTCIFRNDSLLPGVILEWIVPNKTSNSQKRVIYNPGSKFAVFIIENLQENDSGEYKCRAVRNGIPFFNKENTIRVNVKTRKKECTDVMFKCSLGFCIPKRYTCDGHRDCPNGEDESPIHCGQGNPCVNKLMCPDNRCIPFTWCCESHREPNCTTTVKLSCCTHGEKLTRDVDNDLGYKYQQQRFSDMGFLQTTVYTVIGCAMAFMFIVTIIVIAICRVHVRRSLLSRCPASNRNFPLGRGGNIHGNHLNGLSFYDLDLYFNRPGLSGNDLMSINPLLVTYNINNGVQFVGRPIDPPPYCEIVTSPPKEGPPPPYASQENLSARQGDKTEVSLQQRAELSEVSSEAEVNESDALLGATSQNISIISNNTIDVVRSSEEILSAETINQPETSKNCTKNIENTPRGSTRGLDKSDSSHCITDVCKSVEEIKNSGLDILVLKKGDVVTETSGSSKVLDGESSSFVSSSVSDMSKGATKKIASTNSLDSTTRKKNKSFSKGQIKKF